MKSLVSVMLVVLLTTSFAAVACGEWVYVSRRDGWANAGMLDRFDGSGTLDQNYVSLNDPAGVALSPDNGTVYLTTTSSSTIYSYDVETGMAGTTYAMPAGYKCVGLAVDPSGNIYSSIYHSTTKNGMIAKVDIVTGNVTSSWGSMTESTNSNIADIEVYDGKLWGAGSNSNSQGVWTWDLTAGGNSTTVTGTGGTKWDGVAIDPTDGTLYTSNYSTTYNVVKWTAGTPTEIYNFGPLVGKEGRGPTDIDYYDGYLYTAGYLTTKLGKIDLDDNSYSVIVDFPTGVGDGPMYIAVTEIPEPGMLTLLGAGGLIGLLAYAWRKRK